jgi:Flp pilus assembly pilin Flp
VRDLWTVAFDYSVMLALIVLVCVATIRSIGTSANTTFEPLASELGLSIRPRFLYAHGNVASEVGYVLL